MEQREPQDLLEAKGLQVLPVFQAPKVLRAPQGYRGILVYKGLLARRALQDLLGLKERQVQLAPREILALELLEQRDPQDQLDPRVLQE